MRDYLSIGSAPCDENCAQVGDPEYSSKSKEECQRFKVLLLKVFGEPPAGASINTKSFSHDFGQYREVVVSYDTDNPEALNYALAVEGNTPATWDDDKLFDWNEWKREKEEDDPEEKYKILHRYV